MKPGRAIAWVCVAVLAGTYCNEIDAAPRKRPKAGKPARAVTAKGRPPAPMPPAAELAALQHEVQGSRAASAEKADAEKRPTVALKTIRAAERALSRGDDLLFAAYRELIEDDLRDTLPHIEAAAARNDATASFALGVLAMHGLIVDRDIGRACREFSRAFSGGFGGARFRHAQCILETEPQRAALLLREAADSGHVAATELMGRRCLEAEPPDVDCALAKLERAGREGRASATTLLGWMHAEGIRGKPDFARAAAYYKVAAAQGDPTARNNLGGLLENGLGIDRDDTAAFAEYLQSAESGFPPGQFNVGRLYAAGKGIEQDLAKARYWLGLAADSGIDRATRILEIIGTSDRRRSSADSGEKGDKPDRSRGEHDQMPSVSGR